LTLGTRSDIARGGRDDRLIALSHQARVQNIVGLRRLLLIIVVALLLLGSLSLIHI